MALIVGEGDELTTGQIPFTPRAKKVLERLLNELAWIDAKFLLEHLRVKGVRPDSRGDFSV